MIIWDSLIYRAYIVPPVQGFTSVFVNSPCILNSIHNTQLGAAGYTWSVYDGTNNQGTPMFMGDNSDIDADDLRLPFLTGFFFSAAGAVAASAFTFTIALFPQGQSIETD